jgi:hypothetical protein
VAVTPDQIGELGLETAPPKGTDNRAFTGETCQAEAIPPDVLADILTEAVESRIDDDIRAAVIKRQTKIRQRLAKRLGS